MTPLLDVNVLIALFDRDHSRNMDVSQWFAERAPHGWASCAITENGFIRIITQPSYPNAIEPHRALMTLAKARAHSSHQYWNCETSIADDSVIDPGKVLRSSQVTDLYLLALAVSHQGCFVTMDQRISHKSVRGATTGSLVVL